MSRRPIPPATQERQARASDPKLSAWVSAHAGSGKTHVLTQRVVRLLLEGVPPSRILCLTYTKAAAANMAARIHALLANWAVLDDAALDLEVAKLAGPRLDATTRDFARKLFARAVETPGGLKIQTIHAFCERILHCFPFEANAPAGFRVLDDLERGELLARARRETLMRAQREDGALLDAAQIIARETTDKDFDGLIGELLKNRARLGEAASEAGIRALRRRLGLEEDETLASIESEMLKGGLPIKSWPSIAKRLRQGSDNDGKLAKQLDKAVALAPGAAALDDYLHVFLTQKLEPRGVGKTKIITKGLCEIDPELLELMESERDRLASRLEKRNAGRAFERSLALVQLGGEVIAAFEEFKLGRGLLDFDDLITRTRDLLKRANPSWVLYKLDHQIGHILLDEAQDTSTDQWEILAALAREFAQEEAGRGRGGVRWLAAWRGSHRAFEEFKLGRGLLDFDDLITRTRDLLKRATPPGSSTSSIIRSATSYSTRRRTRAPINGKSWLRCGSCAGGKALATPHALCRRRREAVDLLLPGRRAR